MRTASSARSLAAGLLLLALGAPLARAHLGSTKLLGVDVDGRQVRVEVDLDPVDLAYELDLDEPDDATAEDLLPRAGAVATWAAAGFSVRAEGGAPCRVEIAGPVTIVPVEGALRMTRALRVPLLFRCPGAPESLRDGTIFDSDPQHEAIVRVGEAPTVLRAGRQRAALRAPSTLETAGTFLTEGAVHLVTGYDHILFLLSLLLVAGEIARERGARRAVRDVAVVVTAFTVGHSLTLVAAALEVVSLPSRLVESAIAGSIVLVAMHNVARPEARGELAWVAGGFGLIHGFGFSGVLQELLLPTGQRLTALFAFNVGIELAQLALVALVVPLLGWAARSSRYRTVVVRGGSAAIGAVGLYWLITRAFAL